MKYRMGIDLNFTKPSVITLIDKDTKALVFSEVYTSSLIEPIMRVKRHFADYKDIMVFHDVSCRGLIFEHLPNGWPLHIVGDKRLNLIEGVKQAVETNRLTLPFAGGWMAIREDEHLAYALAWFGVNFNPYPIKFP